MGTWLGKIPKSQRIFHVYFRVYTYSLRLNFNIVFSSSVVIATHGKTLVNKDVKSHSFINEDGELMRTNYELEWNHAGIATLCAFRISRFQFIEMF